MARRSPVRVFLALLGLVLAQIVPAPLVPVPVITAWAQSPAEAFSRRAMPCVQVPLPATQLPPTLDPPPAWRGRTVGLRAMIDLEGRIESLRIASSSGLEEFDRAVLAHVKQNWRYKPSPCGRTAEKSITVGIPHSDCLAQPIENTLSPPATEPLPKGESASARLRLQVGRDGRVRSAGITRSSGVASLDAAAIAHIRQNWRYWPMPDSCGGATALADVAFPVVTCASLPLPETQTVPDTEPLEEGQGRRAEMRVAVGRDGTVVNVRITRSSGMPELDQAALDHVKANWRWQPFDCSHAAGDGASVLETFASIDFPVLQLPDWLRALRAGSPVPETAPDAPRKD